MPFGATNFFPFRLGGDFLAEQASRVTADVVAAMRTAPLGVLLVRAGVPSVWYGRNGIGSATFDSGTTYVLGGNLAFTSDTSSGLVITLGTTWIDEIGQSVAVNIVGVDVTPIGAAAAVSAVAFLGNTITLTGPGATDAYVIEIYTDDVARTIDQYGGDLDKYNSTTEGDSPYAWGWLLEMRTMRGSAYAHDGLVDIENIAWARMFAGAQRISEQRAASGQSPANASGGLLNRWIGWLGIAQNPTDSEATKRTKCAAKKRLRQGCMDGNLIPVIQTILGPVYRDIYRDMGTFTSPPVPTYWSEVAIPAPFVAAFSLGTGGGTVANDEPVWSSKRFQPTIIVQVPANKTVQDVANLCESQLMPLLYDFMPSVADPLWGRLDTYGGHDGFILDQSLLDFDLL